MLYIHKSQYFLRIIEPEKSFYCSSGEACRCLDDLAQVLQTMNNKIFEHHAKGKQNDFAVWVREVIGDYYLALGFEIAQDKQDALLRLQERIAHWDQKLEQIAREIETRDNISQ
jgi:hypothetical protein